MDRPDRRRHGRICHSQPVLLESLTAPGGAFALVRNVSRGGLAFSSSESLGESQPVRATFRLDHEFLVAEGRIAWERPGADGRYECGVEFLRMDPLHRAVVHRALGGRSGKRSPRSHWKARVRVR